MHGVVSAAGLIERLEVPPVDHAVVVDVEIGGRPGVVRARARLGVRDRGRQFRLEARDLGVIAGSLGGGEPIL